MGTFLFLILIHWNYNNREDGNILNTSGKHVRAMNTPLNPTFI